MVKKSLHHTLNFIIHNLSYIIFLLLITFKLWVFCKFTDTTLLPNNIGYFTNAFSMLFHGDGFKGFYSGLFLVSIGAVLVISFWTLVLSGRKRFMALLIIDLILSFIMVADVVYYRYFHDLLSMAVLSQANQTGAIEGSIFELLAKKDLLFVFDFIILIPLTIFLYVKKIKGRKGFRAPQIVLSLLVLVFGVMFVRAPINDYVSKYGKVLFQQNWYNMSLYSQTGLIGFHAFDIYRYVDTNFIHKKVITKAQKQNVKDWFKNHQQEVAAETTPFDGKEKGDNVIMVQLEAFNNWFIGKKVNGQEITPNINKLIKETMYYDNFYRETAQGRTSDAEFLTNESMLPLSSGSAYVRFANDDFDSLASTLKENGYQTAAFHAYTKSFWNRYAMYQNHGFEKFNSKEDFGPGEIAGWSLGDRPFFQQSIDKMLTMKQPFYAFMISLSSHHPYDIQSKYRTLNVTGYSGIFADYLESVHYVDAAIGDMVARLKKEGLWDNSILVMYGDHDYGVDDDKDMLKIAGMTDTPLHAEEKFDQIPFIIHLPHSEKPGTYTKTAGQVDVTPTILHTLGISTSNKYMMGSNILTKDNNLVPFRYGSYTNGKVFFVGAQDGIFEHGTCYDMTSEAQVAVDQCRPDYSKSREMYKVSDNIIYGNLIKEFRNKK